MLFAHTEQPVIAFKHIIQPIELYFNFREINHLTIFSCYEIHENVHIQKQLSEKNFSIQIITQSDEWIYPEYTRVGVIADMNCDVMKFYLEKSTENLYFLNNFVWMFYDSLGNLNISDYFRNLDVLPISDVVVIKLGLNSFENVNAYNKWKYFDVYKLSADHAPIITEIDCNATTKEHYLKNFLKFGTVGKRRRNLYGMYINSGIVVSIICDMFYEN